MYHATYQINDQNEHILCGGDRDCARRILIVPPLFDEMNRMRRVLVLAMRNLAQQGIASALPDLPGCNESEAELALQDLDIWRAAIMAAAQQLNITHIASIRGGALIDDGAAYLPRWRLSPVKGSLLLKTMLRTRIASDKESGIISSMDALLEMSLNAPIELAGNKMGPAMLASLQSGDAVPQDNVTTITLGDGPDDVSGSALWMRSEPQDDPAMATSIAGHIDRWSASCGR